MYNAEATVQDNKHHGSTRAHTDVTDAINIMMWAAPLPDGSPGGADWQVLPAGATPIVREFLNWKGLSNGSDPIHSQQIYLTPALLDELACKHGIKAITIRQHVGDAIFIPAGSVHQVL